MTVDELVDRFYHKLNGPDDATAADAMREVVRALRDEMRITVCEGTNVTEQCCGLGMQDAEDTTCCDCLYYVVPTDDVLKLFDEILGSDAGEKVAEMPDLPTRTVQLTGVTKSQRPDIQFEPATDAAPAFYAGQDPKISLNTDAAPVCDVCNGRGEILVRTMHDPDGPGDIDTCPECYVVPDAAPEVCTSCYGTGEDTVMERRCHCQPPDTTTTRCPDCNGEGWDRFGNPCPPCEATGRIPITDPAPAVCEWIPWQGHWFAHGEALSSRAGQTHCPSCGKPIAFKSEAR